MTKAQAHEVLEEIKRRHQKDHPGVCRMLSLGENCPCTLCICDNLHQFIEAHEASETRKEAK